MLWSHLTFNMSPFLWWSPNYSLNSNINHTMRSTLTSLGVPWKTASHVRNYRVLIQRYWLSEQSTISWHARYYYTTRLYFGSNVFKREKKLRDQWPQRASVKHLRQSVALVLCYIVQYRACVYEFRALIFCLNCFLSWNFQRNMSHSVFKAL